MLRSGQNGLSISKACVGKAHAGVVKARTGFPLFNIIKRLVGRAEWAPRFVGLAIQITLFTERPLCVPIRMGLNVPEWARMGPPFKPEWAWSNPVLVSTPHAKSGRTPITEPTEPTPLDY